MERRVFGVKGTEIGDAEVVRLSWSLLGQWYIYPLSSAVSASASTMMKLGALEVRFHSFEASSLNIGSSEGGGGDAHT